jgi:hypothetical protein
MIVPQRAGWTTARSWQMMDASGGNGGLAEASERASLRARTAADRRDEEEEP